MNHHVTAGYSYLTQQDMRLNPEHPPLMKDIAVILLFEKINFDSNIILEKQILTANGLLARIFFMKVVIIQTK